jgi:hypothetical protein
MGTPLKEKEIKSILTRKSPVVIFCRRAKYIIQKQKLMSKASGSSIAPFDR